MSQEEGVGKVMLELTTVEKYQHLSLSLGVCIYIYIYRGRVERGREREREREIYLSLSTRPFYRALQHQCIIHSSSLLTIGAHTHAVHRQQLNCGYKTRILHSQMSRILSSKAICCNTFISTSVKLILCLHTPLSYTHTHTHTHKHKKNSISVSLFGFCVKHLWISM